MHSTNSPLHDKATVLFNRAWSRSLNRPKLKELNMVLQQSTERLDHPLRVALVGKIKAGKSTLVNALLGQDLVATGVQELTFNINWIKFGTSSRVVVHYKDDTAPEVRSRDELEALTKRPEELSVFLQNIKFIEVFYENKFLRTFELIDTPGLMSFYEVDAQNTLDFLNIQSEDITQKTKYEASNADAVLYLFAKSMAQSDKDVIDEFQGPTLGRATPINSIGVLTKIDDYWAQQGDPAVDGSRIANRLITDPKVKSTFYNIFPVSGLVAFGAQTLTEEEFVILKQLSGLAEERFYRLVKDGRKFCGREYDDVPIGAPERSIIWNRLGQYGIWLAYQLLKEENLDNRMEMQEALLTKSGVRSFQDVITSHFGNRALLIKLNTALYKLSAICFKLRQHDDLDSGDLDIVISTARDIESFQKEHAFSEQQVLRDYYLGKLEFSVEEVAQLLEVTGEHGISLSARLGVIEQDQLTVSNLKDIAEGKVKNWRSLANDIFRYSRETIGAARIITRSYERILHQLNLLNQL